MAVNVLQNKKGATLIEVMVALVIFLIVSLALMQTSLISLETNLKNEMRDEAVRIAAERMEEARNMNFDALLSDATPGANFEIAPCKRPPVNDPNNYPVKITRRIRNNDIDFGSRRTVRSLGTDTKEVNILVRWQYRGECYSHSITSIRKKS
ncbi:MAG: type II secretion system GspH family protein [Thermodesulfovibrionales bacterium]|nr:type II secretion system GspH family protein [Thermodesulfovibrionales bacterium]